MNDVLNEENPQTDIPKEEQSSGKNNKSGEASPDAEAKEDSTENLNNKEATMAEKKKVKKLADDVTLKPQDKEHMDMNLIKSSPALMKAYLDVSDNVSGHHGIKRIETKAKIFCDLYEKIDWEKEKTPEKLLEDLKKFTAEYSVILNIADNTSLGIAAKSYIRQGIMFRFQKKCVKKMKLKWEEWFKDNHNPSHLRSVVDRMSVAAIPNVIRYAVFGMTRLKTLKKVIKLKAEDTDPIYTFLNGKNLVFDPESDNPIDEFNKEVDAAVAETMVKNIEEKNELDYGIQADLIKKTVMQGISFDNKVMRNIHLIHKNKGDVNEYLRTRYINKGKEFDVIENENKAKGFRKTVAEMKEAVSVFSADLSKLEGNAGDDEIETIEKVLVELKRLNNL